MEEMDKNLRYWQDKYTRLLEGHHKLQSVNQLLEEKLMNYAAKCSINETQNLPKMDNEPTMELPQEERIQPQMADPDRQQSDEQQQNQIDTQQQLTQQQPQQQQQQPQQQQLQEQPQQQPQLQPQQAIVSPQPATTPEQVATSSALTKVKIYDELNIFDWFKSSGIMNQIAERAKNSVDSVITVLDPGMKSYLFSGGSINILVTSGKESLVASTREAFQEVFGRATINRVTSADVADNDNKQLPEKVTTGLEQAITISLERIKSIREDKNRIPQNQVILDIEPTLTNCISSDFPGLVHDKSNIGLETDENSQLSKWFYTYSMILDDPVLGTFMNSFSQPIPVDLDCVNKINSACINKSEPDESVSDKTSSNRTIDEIMIERLNLVDEDDWIEQWTGISTHSVIYNLSKCMAHLYKRKWQQFTENN